MSEGLSVREFVTYGIRGKSEFGLSHYHMPESYALKKPRVARIHPGIKTTFIDEEVKSKSYIPPAKYNVVPNMDDKSHKSNIMKGKRRLMTDDIATF